MAVEVTSPPAVDKDTFDERWARWIADGREGDRTLHRRAVGAVFIIAAGFAIATVWILRLG
jgi:hypothetical protein